MKKYLHKTIHIFYTNYMKATGIVRRIDELGRVVIPKELRRTMKIREGDPLEIFTDNIDGLVLKKYSPAKEMAHFAEKLAESISDSSGLSVLISDKETIIAVSGVQKKDYIGSAISAQLEEVMTARKPVFFDAQKAIPLKTGDTALYSAQAAAPILAEGDIYGCIVILPKQGAAFSCNSETELLLAKTAATLMGTQII